MFSRREFLQASVAASALTLGSGLGPLASVSAKQLLTQDDLLNFKPFGNVTLVHITDIHAQLKPIYFREPSINLGVGEAVGKPPHITGKKFLDLYNITPGSPEAYALSSNDFIALAKTYGKMGGMDRISTVLNSIRAERDGNMLLLDGGDTWQGSYTSYKTGGQDMITVMNKLKPDAMTGHWEFTYGANNVKSAVEKLPYQFLGGNIYDTEWDEPAFESTAYFDRGGVKIAVIGQAFPYTPIANPRWMVPDWSFGIRENIIQQNVDKAKAKGAQLIVLLSHNGFDVDRKLASRVKGIDVILTGHTHDAIPEPLKVGKTLLIASGSSGKFVSRLDLDVQKDGMKAFKYKLIPIFSDVIRADKSMTSLVDEVRKPYEKELSRVIGKTETLLYRRGNFNGTFDDLICQALLEERDAEISLSPGFRWGTSLIPGEDITIESLFNATGMTYPKAYRIQMTGKMLKDILEDVADNLFNVDPYYQQGGDMVRVGGLGYTINPLEKIGKRISNMTLLKNNKLVEASKEYTVAGWASINQNTQGPAIWDVVEAYLSKTNTVNIKQNDTIKVIGI